MTDAPTARDRLHSEMQDSGVDAEHADQLIDAFAHELADRLRVEADKAVSRHRGLNPSYVYGWENGHHHAADHIDPEVQQ